jgi:hypothetical protein
VRIARTQQQGGRDRRRGPSHHADRTRFAAALSMYEMRAPGTTATFGP